MSSSSRVNPRSYAFSAVGLLTLALLGTSVPVAQEATASFVAPLYMPSRISSGSQGSSVGGSGVSFTIKSQASAADMITELRETTSFTWDQVSKMLGVSRRTVHLWAAGGNMAAHNEERLVNVLREVREIRNSNPGEERMKLLSLLDRERAAHASANDDVNRPAETYATGA